MSTHKAIKPPERTKLGELFAEYHGDVIQILLVTNTGKAIEVRSLKYAGKPVDLEQFVSWTK